VFPEPNLWDAPVSLAREHGRATPDTPAGSGASGNGSRPSGNSPMAGPSGAGSGGSGAPQSPGSPTNGPGSLPPAAVSLLPPDKLLPFMVPFRGGPGPLCGGAASAASTRCLSPHHLDLHNMVTPLQTSCLTCNPALMKPNPHSVHATALLKSYMCMGLTPSQTKKGTYVLCRWSADLGSLVGLGGSESDAPGSASGSPLAVAAPVFALPPEYEEAKKRKVASVADLRNAVKTVQHPSSLAMRLPRAEWRFVNVRGRARREATR